MPAKEGAMSRTDAAFPERDPNIAKTRQGEDADALAPGSLASLLPARRPRGRGAAANPANRFERISVEPVEETVTVSSAARSPHHPPVDPEAPHALDALDALDAPEALDAPDAPDDPLAPRRVATELLRDTSRSIIAHNDSPDVGFDSSINPYRGCEHGCIYCYARPTHEYLGFSAGLDFESRIMVKQDAAALLERELSSPRWSPRVLAMSGVTDCYQPAERRLGITRSCLEVLARFRNPVAVITKNELVTRDLDHLQELAAHDAAAVFLSITTLDGELARRMEPRASHPRDRLKAVERLAQAGVPVGVMVAPVVPAITDHEMPAILQAAADAGARYAGFTIMRLPGAVAGLFTAWLDEHFPERKDKVLNRIRELRGGRLNDPRFGSRMRGEGVFAEQFRTFFAASRRRAGIDGRGPQLSTAAFRRPGGEQLSLFAP
jgi:DNA repair photolyase